MKHKGSMDMDGREGVTYSDYEIMGARHSRLIKDLEMEIEVGVGCPRCRTVNPPLDHSESQKCIHCGLRMQRYGNHLSIWEE